MINDYWSHIKIKIDTLMEEINELRLQIEMLKELDKKDIKINATLALLNLKLFCKSVEISNITNYYGVKNPNVKKRSL